MQPRRWRVSFLVWRDTGHPDGGGSEVFVEEISKRLVAAGHQVTISCAAYDGAPADEVREGITFRRRGGRLGVYLHGLAYLIGPGRRDDVVIDVQNGLPFFSPSSDAEPLSCSCITCIASNGT